MTEGDIWSRIKGWLTGYSVRIENSLSGGISDVLWCPVGLSVFLELKVREGNHIYVRNSQVVFGIHASKSVPHFQHMFIVGRASIKDLMCYEYNTVMRCPSITLESGKQRIDISYAQPDDTWSGVQDVNNYFKFLEKAKRNGSTV